MEILKRIYLFLLILATALAANGQNAALMQKAFRASYTDEGNKSYAAAISDIMPYYSDASYEINVRLGWLHYLNKNYAASQNYYQKAIRLRPNAIEAKFGYVKPLSYLQNWEKVLEQYNDILRIDPQNTQANYWAGVIYYNRKLYDAAIRCFKIVVELYPFDYDGNHMLGWSLLAAGRKAEAVQWFEKALLIKPDDASSLDGLNRAK